MSDKEHRDLAEPEDLKDLLFDHENQLSQAKRRKSNKILFNLLNQRCVIASKILRLRLYKLILG
jgi:hypothetical protein